MFEHLTKDKILERMLDSVPKDIDKREGGIIYDALSPAALELEIVYGMLDMVLNETFADTAGREMLIKRARERGIEPIPAVCAEYLCSANTDLPINSRFFVKGLYFAVVRRVQDFTYVLKCETPGRIGNNIGLDIVPVSTINGLEEIWIIEPLVEGVDEEETERLRQRYIESLDVQSFGGNIAQYKANVKAIPNVGGCKIYPVWAGGGTVKIVICNSEFKPPLESLVNEVQEIIDPLAGQGQGLAPIGHKVTVCGVEREIVDISTEIFLEQDWVFEDIKSLIFDEIDRYFKEISERWESGENLVVRISQIETRILNIKYVVDVGNTLINGKAENFVLQVDCLPERGEING